MSRINQILSNVKYREYIKKNNEYEKEREFCNHDLTHAIDTSRIMYILAFENNLNYSKDVVYACGLLHDIGRWQQYEDNNISHEDASANLAVDVLLESGYNDNELSEILEAIRGHRKDTHKENSLCDIMYKADKLSRKCFMCEAEKKCKWSDSKKNLEIKF